MPTSNGLEQEDGGRGVVDSRKVFSIKQEVGHFRQSMDSDVNASKVEKILKDSLDSIPSPSSSVKIQTMGGKVCLRCKGKTLTGDVNKFLKTKNLLTSPSNVLSYYLK